MNIFKQKEREFALQRVALLQRSFPEAGELLSLLEKILGFQNKVIEELKEVHFDISSALSRLEKRKPALKVKELKLEKFIPYLRELLTLLAEAGTEEINLRARELGSMENDELHKIALLFLEGKVSSELERFIFLAWLQPILHTHGDRIEFNQERWLKNTCPVCGSKPSVSFLMDTSDWEGARFLRCSMCLTDWLYERTKCVACSNSDDDKLTYYTSEEIKHVEIQVCNLCNHYIKMVDMRKDGFAVPDVDDVATVALDLWAVERGHEKIERNLFGL